jgi:hypothetical protein
MEGGTPSAFAIFSRFLVVGLPRGPKILEIADVARPVLADNSAMVTFRRAISARIEEGWNIPVTVLSSYTIV